MKICSIWPFFFFNRTPPAITEKAITKDKHACFSLRTIPGSAITLMLLGDTGELDVLQQLLQIKKKNLLGY